MSVLTTDSILADSMELIGSRGLIGGSGVIVIVLCWLKEGREFPGTERGLDRVFGLQRVGCHLTRGFAEDSFISANELGDRLRNKTGALRI